MKISKTIVLLLGLLALSMGLTAANGDGYQLRGPVSVIISVETGWQRQGMIPVHLDMPGLNLTLWMDSMGQVFEDKPALSAKDEKKRMPYRGLFLLDTVNGRLQAGSRTISGKVYEQNKLRTRLRFEKLPVALQLDLEDNRAVLKLNGIEIPARLHLEQETEGMQKLQIGDQDRPSRGRLMLVIAEGRVYWQDSRLMVDPAKANKIVWAEREN